MFGSGLYDASHSRQEPDNHEDDSDGPK
jgi:hypothetical protein